MKDIIEKHLVMVVKVYDLEGRYSDEERKKAIAHVCTCEVGDCKATANFIIGVLKKANQELPRKPARN